MSKIKSYILNLLSRNLTVKHGLLFLLTISVIFFTLTIYNGNSILKNELVTSCDTCGIGISDLVRRVKKELSQLEDSMVHNNENAMFQLKDMGLEISFVVKQSQSDKIEGSYELVTVEGSRERSNEKVQKLILHWAAIIPKKDTTREVSEKPFGPIP